MHGLHTRVRHSSFHRPTIRFVHPDGVFVSFSFLRQYFSLSVYLFAPTSSPPPPSSPCQFMPGVLLSFAYFFTAGFSFSQAFQSFHYIMELFVFAPKIARDLSYFCLARSRYGIAIAGPTYSRSAW